MVAWNTNGRDVVILAGARTPLCKAGTLLHEVHVADLAKHAMQETLYRANWSLDRVDEVIIGNVVMPADATNLARVSALYAGVPNRVPGLTVQRNCASGLESIAEATTRIQLGREQVVLAGGAESMSTIPLLLPEETLEPMSRVARAKNLWQKTTAVASLRPHHFKPIAGLELGLTDPTCDMIMGKTAEIIAHEFGISRKEQDEFAFKSHQRATAAAANGKLAEEIAPVYIGKKMEPVTADNGPRTSQTLEALANLKPIFDKRDGTVTVGNSCQITDGAVALLIADGHLAKAEALPTLGKVRAYAYAGLDPSRMGLGPVYAIAQLLDRTGMSVSDIGLWEINEAFAAQVLACLKAMNSEKFCKENLDRDKPLGEIDPEKLNVNGGAIALGHPVGATGSRIVLTLLLEMQRRDVQFGVAALCVGGGQGAALLLERS